MSDRIDFDQVREVVRLAAELDVAELEVEGAGLRVRVRRAAPGADGQPAAAVDAAPSLPDPGERRTEEAGTHASDDRLEPIVAPMVGTFYRASVPDAPPFVSENDIVEPGQVVCVIEAMKLFNEIQAERRGRLARVLVENASPVEYGQPLFLLDTSIAAG